MFKTADEAAIAAIEKINPTSITLNVEHAGRIFKRYEKYFFTEAQTLNLDHDSSAGIIVPNAENIGTYHTHAGGFEATDEIFSPRDILKATMGKEISYLGTPCQRILKLTPFTLLPTHVNVHQIDYLRSIYILPTVTIFVDP